MSDDRPTEDPPVPAATSDAPDAGGAPDEASEIRHRVQAAMRRAREARVARGEETPSDDVPDDVSPETLIEIISGLIGGPLPARLVQRIRVRYQPYESFDELVEALMHDRNDASPDRRRTPQAPTRPEGPAKVFDLEAYRRRRQEPDPAPQETGTPAE